MSRNKNGDKICDILDQNCRRSPASCTGFSDDETCFENSDEGILSNEELPLQSLLNNVSYAVKSVDGIGDSPDLITDETPPAEILQLTSDPDLISENREAVGDEGEGTEIGADDTTLNEARAVSEEEAAQSHDLPVPVEERIKTIVDNSLYATNSQNDSDDGSRVSSEINPRMNPDEAREPTKENQEEEKPNMPKVSLQLSDTHFETIDTTESGKINENDSKVEDAPSMPLFVPDPKQIAAVNAPEPEENAVVDIPSPSLANNISNFCTDSSSKLSHDSKNQVEYEHETGAVSTSLPDGYPDGGVDMVGSSECIEEDDLSQNITTESSQKSQSTPNHLPSFPTTSYKVQRESRRKQNFHNNKRTASQSKSPMRLVEVRDRKTPVDLKSKDGKPLSPYLCKIFPIQENKGNNKTKDGNKKNSQSEQGTSKFLVDARQNKLLDGQVARAVEQEKLELIEMMCDFINGQQFAPSDELIADGSEQGTYMSWIMTEKNKERHVAAEDDGVKYWNPMTNIFRRSASTQMSQRPSFCDKDQLTSCEDLMMQYTPEEKARDRSKDKIRLSSSGASFDIRSAARKMYESLKTLQAAIHLSDNFCFRYAPELTPKETFRQPGFLEFFESANELEILQNVTGLLSNCRECIETYLESVQRADLITEEGSCLTKIKDPDNDPEQLQEKNDEKDSEGNVGSEQTPVVANSSFLLSEKWKASSISTTSGNRLLPDVHTFVDEQTKVTLSTYYNDSKTLVQTVMCDGHRYETYFASSEPTGPIHGILKTKKEYIGEPSPINLEILLNTIHRCANYVDTRISCSCVWARQSKRHLLEFIERYMEKQYRPSTDLSWWGLMRMGDKLRQINVFAGIIRSFSGELVEAVAKLYFCMQKTLDLLDKLKEPEMPGFAIDLSNFDEISLNSEESIPNTRKLKERIVVENPSNNNSFSALDDDEDSPMNRLYEQMRTKTDGKPSVEALMKILALAEKDIDSVCEQGEIYISKIKMPRRGRRVLRFMNATSSQLGLSKDVQLGSLIANFLSAVDKIPLFEEFICEQRAEIRSKVCQLCMKITRNLYDLRCSLIVQQDWSGNLSRNSFMRIKEINEIRRLRKLRKNDRYINEKMEFLRGSDQSLRNSLW